MLRCAVAVIVVSVAASVSAAPSSTKQVPTFTPVTPSLSTTIYADRPTLDPGVWDPAPSGGVRVRDNSTLTLPSGSQGTITSTRTVSNAAIKTAAKSIAKNLIPGLNIAITVYDILNPKGVEADPNGGWVIDPGQIMQETGGRMVNARHGGTITPGDYARQEAEFNCGLAAQNGRGCVIDVATGSCVNGTCNYQWSTRHLWPDGSTAAGFTGGSPGAEVRDQACPESDSTLPTRGKFGPCKSNNRVRPSDDDIDDVLDEIQPDEMPGLVDQWARGIPGGIPTDGNAPELSGPPVVSDPPSVTTKPDGSIETRQRHWDLEYPGDGTIRYTPRLVEVAPGGTTITTGEGAAPPGSSTAPDLAECLKTPDVIGCSKYGTPQGTEVQKRTESVTFDRVALGGGSCPADRAFEAFGTSYAISWQPICDATVSYVKPTVLLIFGGMAAFIFIAGFKS